MALVYPLGHFADMNRASPHPAAMYWGDDLVAIYNEAYIGMGLLTRILLLDYTLTSNCRPCWPEASATYGPEL